MRCRSSSCRAGKGGEFLFPLPFVIFRSILDWVIPILSKVDWGRPSINSFLSSLIHMLISSRNTLPDTPRNKLTITGHFLSMLEGRCFLWEAGMNEDACNPGNRWQASWDHQETQITPGKGE